MQPTDRIMELIDPRKKPIKVTIVNPWMVEISFISPYRPRRNQQKLYFGIHRYYLKRMGLGERITSAGIKNRKNLVINDKFDTSLPRLIAWQHKNFKDYNRTCEEDFGQAKEYIVGMTIYPSGRLNFMWTWEVLGIIEKRIVLACGYETIMEMNEKELEVAKRDCAHPGNEPLSFGPRHLCFVDDASKEDEYYEEDLNLFDWDVGVIAYRVMKEGWSAWPYKGKTV